jgi:hypothetical protein
LTNAATQILEACEAALRAFIVDRKATPIVLARLERATFLTGILSYGIYVKHRDQQDRICVSSG